MSVNIGINLVFNNEYNFIYYTTHACVHMWVWFSGYVLGTTLLQHEENNKIKPDHVLVS